MEPFIELVKRLIRAGEVPAAIVASYDYNLDFDKILSEVESEKK